MAESNKILVKMLDRLFASMVNGPSLNCRPYASRQRLDVVQLGKLDDASPEDVLRALLGPARKAVVKARVTMPKGGGAERKAPVKEKLKVANAFETADEQGVPFVEEMAVDESQANALRGAKPAERAWLEQQAVLTKLHTITEDARTYEQDTGVSVLNVGFPLLSLPPGALGAGAAPGSRRVLAPIAFIPVAVTVKRGATQSVELACKGEGVDLVMPNTALLAWLEQQAGKPPAELDGDEEGTHPWREICDIVRGVCRTLDIDVPEAFVPPVIESPAPTPRSHDAGGHDVGSAPPNFSVDHAENVTKESNAVGGDAKRSAEPNPGGSAEAADESLPRDTGLPPVPGATSVDEPHAPPSVDTQHGRDARVTREPIESQQRAATATASTPAGQKSIAKPDPFADVLAAIELLPAPKADESSESPVILPSAVLGLFPMSNQGLLRDMQAMIAGEGRGGPVESFLQLGVSLDHPAPALPPETAPPQADAKPVAMADERFISGSDPCQGRAVRLARQCKGLVVHGPPGTGKSQTITNVIGDHLARGQRVLVVCDKRTALDVVFNRLRHMGLGGLCALVHDPRRDQRELYKTIRQQLDELPETRSDDKADAKLAKADSELQALHDELTAYRAALAHRDGEHGPNFHELVGQWLALTDARAEAAMADDVSPASSTNPKSKSDTVDLEGLQGVKLELLDAHATAIDDVLKRAEAAGYGTNPWVDAVGISLAEFLAIPMDKVRAAAADCAQAARTADATRDPDIPPFAADITLPLQATGRATIAGPLKKLLESTDPNVLARWAGAGADELRRARQILGESDAFVKTFRAAPLDGELAATARERATQPPPTAQQLADLAAYQQVAGKWYAFLPLKAKARAAPILNSFGLTLGAENAVRLHKFLTGLRARLALAEVFERLAAPRGTGFQPVQGASYVEQPQSTPSARTQHGLETRATGVDSASAQIMPDDVLDKAIIDHSTTIDLLLKIHGEPGLTGLGAVVSSAFLNPENAGPLIEGLRKSPGRADALAKMEDANHRARLFDAAWLAKAAAEFRSGSAAEPVLAPLAQRVDSLEGALRVRQGLASVPIELREPVTGLVMASVDAESARVLLRREATAGEIARRLRDQPQLLASDARQLQDAFDRYRSLDEKKHELTRDAVVHRWISKQKERLLASTGTRLNAAGADLRRRLTIRGERAMRLRQVVAVGSKIEGGDPLFDLCPIWLASPETVAQVFPRKPVFDVVVFDEASQCRLEEALPVIVRGERVVIAGDPKQLPPTRFFESAVAASDEEDPETDQDLFEQQQGEVEDLLGAALGLDIQQCYLDVHYRSRDAGLIAFSNEHFYGSRLQPIPAHPSNHCDDPPVVLERVAGVYEKRRNEAEAQRIVEIVKGLLSKKDPPSIGIACFNLPQRDLIVEKLDELAEEDAAFGRRLEKARERQGAGSFEGLFVKNLENVQGDERDHILISTTYGPDAKGRFYRRFGPVGRAGGGRRLNVLVTRAREKVHVVTSIPAEAYRTLPQPEPGQTPGGTWLLFAYLKFAEKFRPPPAAAPGDRSIEPANAGGKNGSPAPAPSPATASKSAAGEGAKEEAAVNILPTKTPSVFAEALAGMLAAKHGVGSDVHWGNEGFCVDLALHHPQRRQEVTAGILCDAARYAAADDPMEWDVFRTGILESQGWKLHRVWTPHFYRDPSGVTREVVAESRQPER
ncbi:MAG TPA: AAA domain-containing protein [Tepidisphaeraceae bacterium]|nr:AAA domain-containing protein [Tepidisphaeraceae bacterium]